VAKVIIPPPKMRVRAEKVAYNNCWSPWDCKGVGVLGERRGFRGVEFKGVLKGRWRKEGLERADDAVWMDRGLVASIGVGVA
jgi:hypothetical protein